MPLPPATPRHCRQRSGTRGPERLAPTVSRPRPRQSGAEECLARRGVHPCPSFIGQPCSLPSSSPLPALPACRLCHPDPDPDPLPPRVARALLLRASCVCVCRAQGCWEAPAACRRSRCRRCTWRLPCTPTCRPPRRSPQVRAEQQGRAGNEMGGGALPACPPQHARMAWHVGRQQFAAVPPHPLLPQPSLSWPASACSHNLVPSPPFGPPPAPPSTTTGPRQACPTSSRPCKPWAATRPWAA